jgi:hypothetical protein
MQREALEEGSGRLFLFFLTFPPVPPPPPFAGCPMPNFFLCTKRALMPPHHVRLFLGSRTHTLYCVSVLHHQRIYTASAPVYGDSILHERNVLRCRSLIEYQFFFLIGRGKSHPPPASDTAVRVMKEFNKLIKKVPCSEGLVRPHVKVSNFVVMLKFKQVFFFSLKESLIGLIGPIR